MAAVTISSPAQNANVNVRVAVPPANCNCGGGGSGTGSGGGPAPTRGYITAAGHADMVGTEVPRLVYGKIISGPDPTNATPDSCTAEGAVEENGDWAINMHTGFQQEIPCAICGPASAPLSNKLFVWVVYANGSKQSASVYFFGVCPGAQAGARLAPSAAKAMLAMAPKEWHVQGQGFGKGKTRFNSSFNLKLVSETDVRWANEGDGEKKVRVELDFDPTRSMEWCLLFKLRKTSITFFQTNQNWGMTKNNDLLYTGGDPQKKGVPAKVQVKLA